MTDKNIIQVLFEKHTNHFPKSIAALNGSQILTYAELNQKANRVAHYLLKLGLKPDTPVALCLERSFDFLIALIAILKAGGAYLPMDPSQPEERLVYLLNDSQASIVITKSTFEGLFASFQGKQILLDRDEKKINKESTDNPELVGTAEHLAYIIYTSGSTGAPKGVLIEHRSVVNYCKWFADYSQCERGQRIDYSGNSIFDMTVTTTVVPLMLGMTVVICNEAVKREVHNYLRYLAKSRVNIIKLTPSYFKVLLCEAKTNFIALPNLKYIILGGENLSTAVCHSWLALYPEHILFNEYGPTEATVAASIYKVSKQNCADLEANVPIGKAGSNMSCTILDSHYQPVPDGEIGELFIGGIGLARGYLNQPELTQQRFITKNTLRLYQTGDLCKKRPDEVIEYLGRIDEQVKIRGYRIEPGEIEKLLLTLSDIKEVVVIAQKDSLSEERLVAYYSLKCSNSTLNTKYMCQFLQKRLPDYMIPSVFVKIDSIPLTANGKLDKNALPTPELSLNHNYVAPRTVLEKKLAKIWREELGLKSIGIHDDFFDLGGHSLSAARIVSKLNSELQRSISLLEFYKASNITQLTSIIKRTKRNKKKRLFKNLSYRKITNIPLCDFQFLLWMSHTFEPKVQKLNIVGRKRFQGRLNEEALEFAFQAILRKHVVLTYKVLKLQSAQRIQKSWSFKLITNNLDSLSTQQSEAELQQSMTQLINFYPWPKNAPLIIGKLFYLQEDESELQICIPHLISDDDCMDILFSDLSLFYQNYKQLALDEIEADSYFKEYIFVERNAMKMHLNNDIPFWEEYLKDSGLFAFPEEQVISNMKGTNLPYSTYTPIPKNKLIHFKHFCEQNHIGINNALGATVALALRNCCGNNRSRTPYTYMNIIQSTRDNPNYDNTIGCFLRVEPTKIILDDATTLIPLSQQIRQSIIETSNYQQCSNLIKMCSIDSFKPNKIDSFLISLITPLYTKLLKIPSIYREILYRCSSRMLVFKRNTKFLINLNIRSNFIDTPNKSLELFGLNTKPIEINNDDLLAINYIFEASFIRDDNQDAHYLVISANLKPEFREMIAQEVLRIMDSVAFEKNSEELEYVL